MFVQEDFKYLRIISNNKLQWFPATTLKRQKLNQKTQKYDQGYLKFIQSLVHEFASNFTMHGMNRILKSDSHIYKRITWIVGFFLCLIVLVNVCYWFANKYQTQPLQTVVADTNYPVFRIPFPEVTICNRNRFNWQRFEMAKRMFLKPRHQIMPQYQKIFTQVVNAYDTLSFGKFFKFKNLTQIPPSTLQELSYINFQTVNEFMAWKCHEIFSLCKWLDNAYSCCDIFFLRNSPLGSCLAFNTIESPNGLDKQKLDPFWPWRTKHQGMYNGLSVRIQLRNQFHSPRSKIKKGILVMLAEHPVWFKNPIKIDSHTKTSIAIKGILYTHSHETRFFSPKVRECLFQDEQNSEFFKTLPDRAYMFENCRAQCHLEYLVKFCNCTVGLFYPSGAYRQCRLSDYPCLVYHNDNFRNFERNGESEYVYKCKCFYSCNSLSYVTTVTTAYMNNIEVDFNNSFIDLNVFFQQEYIMRYLTILVYNWTDIMSGFGGLVGLCIGCSLLNLVEIVYFFIIDVPLNTLLYFKTRKNWRLRRKSRAVKVNIMQDILKN